MVHIDGPQTLKETFDRKGVGQEQIGVRNIERRQVLPKHRAVLDDRVLGEAPFVGSSSSSPPALKGDGRGFFPKRDQGRVEIRRLEGQDVLYDCKRRRAGHESSKSGQTDNHYTVTNAENPFYWRLVRLRSRG